MDSVVKPISTSRNIRSESEQELLIAGCSAPDVLKVINSINGEGSSIFKLLGFIDVDEKKIRDGYRGYPVWHEERICASDFKDVAVSINIASSMKLRWSVVNSLKAKGFKLFPTLVHPLIDTWNVTLGEGTTILQGTLLGPEVVIGDFSLMLMGAIVNHEVKIGCCSFLGPGSIVLGRAVIGNRTYIGSGAIIFPGVNIGDDVTVGAGAVVRENIPSGKTVAGVPARVLYAGIDGSKRNMTKGLDVQKEPGGK